MEYRTVGKAANDEFVEKKSRFIGYIKPVTTQDEAVAFINEIKSKHWDATHNVYAYVLRDGQIRRYSDDGEPQGTAGIPMLEVLKREGIENVVCVVTRYFGGVLLGAGGLLRAYTKSAKDALDAAGVSVVRRWVRAEIPCTYSLLERIKLECTAFGGVVQDVEYGAGVCLKLLLPEEAAESFAVRITDLTSGAAGVRLTGEEFMPVRIK